MTEITINRALVELKTLGKRIDSALQQLNPVAVIPNDDAKIGNQTIEEFAEKAKSTFQSLHDLVTRKTKIKAAISLANSNTKVTIGNKEYTITEALVEKDTLGTRMEVLQHLKSRNRAASAALERQNQATSEKLDSLINATFGKDRKVDSSEISSLTEAFKKNNTPVMVDPLNLQDIIEKMESEITEFLSEVDIVLSEVNAVTKIIV